MQKTETSRLRDLLDPALSISSVFKDSTEEELDHIKAKTLAPLIKKAELNKKKIFELSRKRSQKLIQFIEQVYELIEVIKTDQGIKFDSICYLLNVQDLELRKEIDWLLQQAEHREQLEILLAPSRILPHLLRSEIRDEVLIEKNIQQAIENESLIIELIKKMNNS